MPEGEFTIAVGRSSRELGLQGVY